MNTPPDESSPATLTLPGGAEMPAARRTLRRMGRYELIDELGRGGMGVVYRAWDPELSREVALKVLTAGAGASEAARVRFLREARAAARLMHPGIVRVYDIGEQQGGAWFTMPLVKGPTLSARLKAGPVSPQEAARWIAQVARALQHAHEHGLIHRDVKPGNVLLEGGEVPLLADFGLVRSHDADEVGLTQESQILGTPAYMAPEQVLGGADSVGPASDQYGLGVMLYELLAGVRPFPEPNPALLLRQILDTEPPPLPARVPRPLVTIVERAMCREPRGRYPSCAALADDLDRYLRGEVVVAGPSLSTSRLRQALRRHRRPLDVVRRAGLVGIGVVGALLLGLRWRDARQEEARAAAAEARRAALEPRLRELFAGGRVEEATAQFQEFASFEANQGTPALAAGWRMLGALRAEVEDPDGALDAYANAWLLAEERDSQVEVLLDMAAILHDQQQWPALFSVLSELDRLEVADSAALQEWRRDVALARGDRTSARALTDDPLEVAALEALTHGTATPHQAQAAVRLDLDQDGRDELILKRDFNADLWVVDTTSASLPLRAVATGILPATHRYLYAVPAVPGQPPAILHSWGDAELWSWDGAGFQRALTMPVVHVSPAVGDVDGDGADERYVATPGDVLRIDADGVLRPAAADHHATRVATASLAITDLNLDGRRELVAGTSTWSGYDVRLLEQGEDGLHIVTRRRLGAVAQLLPIRLAQGPALIVWRELDPREVTNRTVFRPGEPEGEARGLHVLTRGPQGLERRALLPLPMPPEAPNSLGQVASFDSHERMVVADINGDSLDDVLFAQGLSWTIAFIQHADGRFTQLSLPGFLPLAAVPLDDDPELEIVAMRTDDTHQVWVLGSGDTPVPAVPFASPEVRPAPGGLTPDLSESWARAEALVAIGRTRAAAERFEVLAGMAQDETQAAAGRMRAGELYVVAGEHARASRLFLEASRAPSIAPAALEASMRAAMEDLDLERAVEAGRARLALADAPTGLADEVARVERALAQPELEYDFTRGLDPAWHVLTPIGVKQRAGVGLEVLSAERQPILELPVWSDGGPYRLEMEIELNRLDWGGMVSFGLQEPDQPARTADLWLASGGGANVLEQGMHCLDFLAAFRIPLSEGAITGRALSLVYELDPARTRAACAWTGVPSRSGRVVQDLGRVPRTAGRQILRIGANPAYSSQALAVIQRVRFRGLRPLDEPASAEQGAWHLLAVDRAAEALDELGALRGPRVGLGRAQALDALGRRAEAGAALSIALAADEALGGELGRVFRGALEVFEPELRAHFGERYPLRLWQYSAEVIQMHPADPPAQELLTHYFAGVDEIDPRSLPDDAARGELAEILCRRAAAWRRAGRSGAALQDLARAEQIALGVAARDGGEDGLAARRLLPMIARERALLHLSRGETDAAMDELLAGLSRSPAPTVYADIVVSNPEFDALRPLPGWRAIEAARLLWPAAPE